MKKILMLATVLTLSGCGIAFVNGPPSGWRESQDDSDALRGMAVMQPCSTGKFPIIGDVIIGGFGAGLVIAELYNQTQHDPGFVTYPDGTRHSVSGWGETEKTVAGFGAALAAPYLLSAVLGNRKVNDCKAFHEKLQESLTLN
jgi:hypothetical protein